MVILVLYLAEPDRAATIYTQLMARVTQGFLHKTRTRMFSRDAKAAHLLL